MASTASDDYPSDTDLSGGLPSPDASDDEEIKNCQDLGIIVPHFCNKLRTLTRPVFPGPQPAVLSDLCGLGHTTEKPESKKKTTKDEAEVSRKSLSHSGYASSPRWTKSPSVMRSYDPCDITGDDEFEIAGVVFRNSTSGKDRSHWSSRDCDFPSLSESSQSDISELSKSDTSFSVNGLLSQDNKIVQSPLSKLSPVTSTPLQKNRSSSHQESPLSLSHRQPETSPFNNEPVRCDLASKLDPKSNSRSKSKGNRRRSKRLSHNLLDGGNPQSLDSSTCDRNANNSISPGFTDGTKGRACLESKNIEKSCLPQINDPIQVPIVGKDKVSSPVPNGLQRRSDLLDESNGLKHSANKCSPTWSNIVKTSPRLSPVMRIDSPRNYYMEDVSQPCIGNESKHVDVKKAGVCEPVPIRNSKSNSEKRNRVQLMPVDSCVTPSKKNENDNWPSQNNADVLAFENRFVEKIAISASSPPKKVNPSPIKKLDFSKNTAEKENKGWFKKEAVCRRQVSLISDLDWKKVEQREPPTKNGKSNFKGNKERNFRGRRQFSLEDFARKQEVPKLKDELSREDDDEKEMSNVESNTKVNEFWIAKRVVGGEELKTFKTRSENKNVSDRTKRRSLSKPCTINEDMVHGTGCVDKVDVEADMKQVILKPLLRKYARRYCHFVEGHFVTNISREMLFILQLLTCSDSTLQAVRELDSLTGRTLFGSVHNCVYFAILVIKRLKWLFSCLPKTTLHLFATNPRIKKFSPKLHNFFKVCMLSDELDRRNEDVLAGDPQDFGVLGLSSNWSGSFSNIKMAHVFKCQRDNFFALYKRYHDSNDEHPFRMSEQIHFVYDSQISDHNSVVNLMHLAQLLLDHLLQSSIKHSSKQINFLDVSGREEDSAAFMKKFEKWRQSNSFLTFGPPTKWDKNEVFFKDLIDAMRCPSFNELLKNMIVSRILELNGTEFEYLKNLHSPVCLPDDQTPQRCERFTTTLNCLCILGKMLGYLVFASYSGGNELSAEECQHILTVRSMIPLPLPLPEMLKAACDKGHLCLTVPWVVQYLSMMDAITPKLTAYSQVITLLNSIHRYSWNNLLHKGHQNVGLLISSCISWLFESPVLQRGLIYSQLSQPEHINCPQRPCLDTQRVVTSKLLYSCCPYLNAGHIPLVMYTLNYKSVLGMRQVMLLTPEPQRETAGTTLQWTQDREIESLCQRLGLSLPASDERDSSDVSNSSDKENIEPNTEPSVVPKLNCAKNSLNELTSTFLNDHPYLSNCIHRSVELMCGKVQDYALSTILKLGVFDARVKVRRKFMNMDSGEDADSVKRSIMANSNITAQKFSCAAKQAFFQTGERVCQMELVNLINFLASHVGEQNKTTAINIAQKAAMSRLTEWAKIQLNDSAFHKVIVNEAEKVASTWSFKPCSLYPSDFMRKPEYSSVCLEVSGGFEHLQQLSNVLDTALACGGWYMNGQTRGPRPDDVFIHGLMEDFMVCINNHSVSMDFSFSIMINFLMHLIIQYITDAPQNWTDDCLETFIGLCALYELKKSEDDRVSFQPLESSHKSKKIKMNLTNLISVHSLEWLSKSLSLDHSLMAYCNTIVKLVEANLITIEKVMDRLTTTRVNHHLTAATKLIIDRIMVKVLELLFTNEDSAGCSSAKIIMSMVHRILDCLTEWGSEKALAELKCTFGDVLQGNSVGNVLQGNSENL